MIVPEHPAEFIDEFLPRYFAQLTALPAGAAGAADRAGAAGAPGRSPAPVGVVLRVVGAGEWTLRIVEDSLRVEPGSGADAALQLSVQLRDFAPLVVEPLRRALASESANGEQAGSAQDAGRHSARLGLWSRLGRWDDETVELLRQQAGRILVRVDDQGQSRNVALTPGSQPYSLDTAECTIDCRLADLLELQAKQTSPLDLFYSGKLRLAGDAQIALAMAGLFL